MSPLFPRSSTINQIKPTYIFNSVIGLSDGLTVPFALTAGLSSLGESKLVVLGGVAELIAGAISMGVGGFCESIFVPKGAPGVADFILLTQWLPNPSGTTIDTCGNILQRVCNVPARARWNVKCMPSSVPLG